MKRLILLIFILTLAIPQLLFSQTGWVKEITALGNKRGDHVVNTNDGNIVFTVGTNEGLGNGSDAGSYLIKSDLDGNYIWTKKIGQTTQPWGSRSVLATMDGGYLIQEQRYHEPSDEYMPHFLKLDENGNELSSNYYWFGTDSSVVTVVRDIVETNDGGFYIAGYEGTLFSSPENGFVRKVDSDFNEIWTSLTPKAISFLSKFEGDEIGVLSILSNPNTLSILKIDTDGNELFEGFLSYNISCTYDFRSLPDGGFMVFNFGGGTLTNLPLVTRLDSSGNIVWQKLREDILPGIPDNAYPFLYSPVQVTDGFIYTSHYGINGNQNPIINLGKINFNGEIVWYEAQNTLPGSYSVALEVVDNGNSIIGIANGHTYNSDIYLFKANAEGIIYTNQIKGKVGYDEQPNCQIDSNEIALPNWLVTAENDSSTYYSYTDNNGNYSFSLDTGDYVLQVHPPSNLWDPCENNINVSIDTTNPIIEQDFPMEDLTVSCPALMVNGVFPGVRPCFETRYVIQYANAGTEIGESAFIEVEADSNLTYLSSSIDLASQNGNTYTFNLGDLAIGASGVFFIDFFADCDLVIGENVCIESHIYPDTVCLTSPNWNGAFIEVDAYCQDSTVNFYLENVGIGDMTETNEYVVIEDAILLISNPFQLLSGQIDSFSLPANGLPLIMVAEQIESAPGDPFPAAWVLGCPPGDSMNYTIGYLNQFSLGDSMPYLDIDCRIVTNSFDPNDKQGFPNGYGEEHFIRPNTDIEYLIRFQNTGTDVAHTVVIRDSITSELDLTSLEVGPSSHNYTWRIYNDNVLEFTFNNIMLPDSNANEPASHGFVEFKIAQQPDLAEGTVFRNKAGIYFDFNEPVITNETFHTIGLDFITVSTQEPISEQTRIHVYPNPLQEFAIFEMKKEIKDGLIEIYDLSGKLAWQQKVNGKQFELKRNDLKSGFYFYKISDGGQAINSGKIVVK